MATHEFGIMDTAPLAKARYDSYEPEKYNCIKIHDEHIELILNQLECVNTYWHTLERPAKGLAYWGVTIIPPNSLNVFLTTLAQQHNKAFEPLITLINKAICNQNYIIHFGI